METELADYIFEYCFEFYTDNERKAKRHHFWQVKFEGKAYTTFESFDNLEKSMRSDDPEVLRLLQNGYAYFMMTTAVRIYREHKSALNLNLCPRCQKIARTPQAKQCRFCGHRWRD